jgi:hypothetical protein
MIFNIGLDLKNIINKLKGNLFKLIEGGSQHGNLQLAQ